MSDEKLPQGLTLYICIGKFSKFRIETDEEYIYLRVVMGWMSVSLMKYDVELAVDKLLRINAKQKLKLK